MQFPAFDHRMILGLWLRSTKSYDAPEQEYSAKDVRESQNYDFSVLVKLMIRQEAPTGARNKTRCAETNGEDGTGDNPCNEGCCCGPFCSNGDHMAKLLLF